MFTVKTATKIASIWREENKITLVTLPKKQQSHSLCAASMVPGTAWMHTEGLIPFAPLTVAASWTLICEATGHSLINLSQPPRPVRIQPWDLATELFSTSSLCVVFSDPFDCDIAWVSSAHPMLLMITQQTSVYTFLRTLVWNDSNINTLSLTGI